MCQFVEDIYAIVDLIKVKLADVAELDTLLSDKEYEAGLE
ncbi:hypothetical protein QMG_0655 [Clostridioides difficile DA00256]|nr:hypothetical protein QMG_0655 [Clostridioides difficile DA00256]